jgi:hypothetical protein
MRRLLQLTILCLFISGGLFAQNRFWVGTAANGDWHDAANWALTSGGAGGASVPGGPGAGAALTAIFDGGSSANADVNSITILTSVQIRATYTGTITQSDLLFVSGNMVVSGGTFNGVAPGGAPLVVSGTYTQNGGAVTLGDQASTITGAFTLTGTGTFTTGPANLTFNGNVTVTTPANFSAPAGTVIFDGSISTSLAVGGGARTALILNNVTLNKVNNTDDLQNNFSIPGADTLVARGTLTLTNGNLEGTNSVIRGEGNVNVLATFDGATGGDLVLGGAANQTVALNRTFGITLNSGIVVNKTNPAATVSFTTAPSNIINPFANPSAFFTVNSGTVNFPDNDQVEMNVVNFTIGPNGSFISTTGLMNLTGNFLNNSTLATGFQHNNGTVAFTGTFNRTYNVRGAGTNGSTTFYNVILNKSNAPGSLIINNGDTLIAENNLQLTDGTLTVASGSTLGQGFVQANGNLTIAADVTALNNFLHLIFGGATPSNIALAAGTEGHINGPVTFNKSGGGITLASPINFDYPAQQINFNGGIVTSTATNFITFGTTAVANGGSNGSYIDGPVRKTGVTAFTFPTGDGGFFAPVRISGNVGFNDAFAGGVKTFQAEYFHTDPDPLYDTESIQDPNPLLKVSNVEYWRVSDVGTVTAAQRPYLWLSYEDARSGGLTVPATVYAAAWLAADQWANLGNGGLNSAGGVNFIRSGTRNTTTNEADPVFTFITDEPENNPLPVTWLGFTGRYYNGVVELNWSTSLELNNASFTVERSGDGDKYQAIGTVPGKGTTNYVSYYNFIDKEPVPGVNHYRIKQTDIDGKFSYSKEIRVTTAALSQNGLRLFPNPMTASQPLILENADWKNQKATISIFSSTGGLVQQEQITFGADSRSRLNLSRLKKGSYFITTTLPDGKKQTLTFIVQ